MLSDWTDSTDRLPVNVIIIKPGRGSRGGGGGGRRKKKEER